MSGTTPPDFTELNAAMAELSTAADTAAAALAKAQAAAVAVQGAVTPPVVTPPVVTPPKPVPPATPSADGTVASAIGDSIVSAAGNRFSLIQPGTSRPGMAVAFNAREDTHTQGVSSLLAFGGKCYQLANTCEWYVSTDAIGGWSWCANGDPRNPTPPVVTPPVVTPPVVTPPVVTPPVVIPPGSVSPFPRFWGAYGYPNPGPYGGGPCDQGAAQSAGGANIPFGSATSNLAFFAHGGTANGKVWPGMGVNIGSHNAWVDMTSGDTSFWSNGWAAEGGPFAGGSGLVPVQGIITQARSGALQPAAVAAGNYDSLYQGIVSGWANNGVKTLIIRPDYEWNIANCPMKITSMSQVPTIIAAWRRVYAVMHAQAAKLGIELIVLWNPDMQPWNFIPLSDTYPGDDACDGIGLDLYASLSNIDNSQWTGYAALKPGSSDQLSGWTAGGQAANQMALAQSPNVKDALWHYYDFPGALQSSPLNGSTMQSNGKASFGGESAWGVMDAIAFAKAHGKPLAFPEIGYCSQLNTPTTSGKPTWSCDITSIGIADTNFAPYLKSRMAYAASLGVPTITVNFNCYAPYDPYFIQGGSFGGGGTTAAMVQSINDCFAGTGTPMPGFDLLKGRTHLGHYQPPVFCRPHHHGRRVALTEHYRQMPY